jgi:phage-related protein
MAFVKTDLETFYNNLEIIRRTYGIPIVFFSQDHSLITVVRTLNEFLDHYKQDYKVMPYNPEIFYMHVLIYIDREMQKTPENRDLMNTIYDNLETLIPLAKACMYAPSLEEWERE